jgi:hypothetical protein
VKPIHSEVIAENIYVLMRGNRVPFAKAEHNVRARYLKFALDIIQYETPGESCEFIPFETGRA